SKVRILVFIFLYEAQIVAINVLNPADAQRRIKSERHDARTALEIAKCDAISCGKVCSFDCCIDLVTGDVDQTIVFSTRGSGFLELVFPMKSQPYTAIGITITHQGDFFRSSERHTERIDHVDQLAEALAIDE